MTATDIDSVRPLDPSTQGPACLRKPLGLSSGAILITLVLHIAAAQTGETPQAHHGGPARFLHIFGVFATLGLLGAVLTRRPRAATYTMLTGASAAAAMVVLHILPIETHYTAFYGSQASILQWATVFGVFAAGLAASVIGWRHRR